MKPVCFTRRSISLLLCASLTGAVLTGCKKGDDMFPSIGVPDIQTSQTDESDGTVQTTPENEIRHLSVALPYSDLTVQCLASMLYCKNNGLWDSAESGLTIDTDYLSSVATNYVITNIGCGSTGASLGAVKAWQDEGNTPDLFLTQDSEAMWKGGYVENLNGYLSDSTYMNAQQIFTGALTNDSYDGIFFAVPHFCSAELIMGNSGFIPSESGKLQTKSTTEDMAEYLLEISEEYSCVPFASAYELIPYLGSAFNGDEPTSYMVFDEYIKDKDSAGEIIEGASSYIRGLYTDELASDSSEGSDPVYSRQAALWADSSANVRAWADYYPGRLYLLHLPCDDATNTGVPYISTYSLCVTKDSANSGFAAEFAAFISFDPDAQMLIYRLEDMTGLMPLTRNDSVWDLISEDELFGHMASDIRQTMDNAVYCPSSYDSKVFTNTNEYTAEFVKGDDEFDAEKCYG